MESAGIAVACPMQVKYSRGSTGYRTFPACAEMSLCCVEDDMSICAATSEAIWRVDDDMEDLCAMACWGRPLLNDYM